MHLKIFLLILASLVMCHSEKCVWDGKDKTLNVLYMPDRPYFVVPEKKGDDPTGFFVDVIREVFGKLNFTKFKFSLSKDGGYGRLRDKEKPQSYKSWTGMVGAIGNPDSEYCIAGPLTITSTREKVIDFLKPIHHSGISILTKKLYTQEQFKNQHKFSFSIFSPFDVSVWFSCIIGFFLTSCLLWLMNKYNPYEWSGRYNLGRASEHQAEAFNFTGSLWYAYTTLQWQGYEKSPRSLSAKTLSAFWLMFVTLTMVTYTGALINNLFWASTSHYKDFTKAQIHDIYHLISDDKFHYGIIDGGATYAYLEQRSSKDPVAKTMMDYWNTKKGEEYKYKSTAEALSHLNTSKNFAMIMETASAKYHANNAEKCDLAVVQRQIHTRSIGLAFAENLPISIKKKVLEQLHNIEESGALHDLENIWFEEFTKCNMINKVEEYHVRKTLTELNEPKSIDISIFKGALILISVGIIISVIVAAVEVLYFKYKGRYQTSNQPGGQQLKIDEDQHI